MPFINWNIPQRKLLKVAHILSGNSPHRLITLTLDTALFCHVSVNPCISFHFSLTLAPNLKSYPAFPPLFSPIFSILLPSKLSLSLTLCLSTLLSFPCPSLSTSWWNWLAVLRRYQWLNNSTPLSTVQGNNRSRCSWKDSPLQIPLSFPQNCLKVLCFHNILNTISVLISSIKWFLYINKIFSILYLICAHLMDLLLCFER